MYLPHTAVFSGRAHNNRHSMEAELKEAKRNVNILVKTVGFLVILNVIVVCVMGGLVANALIHHDFTDALKHDLDTVKMKQNLSEISSQSYHGNIDRQLAATNSTVFTLQEASNSTVLALQKAQQRISNVHGQLETLNTTMLEVQEAYHVSNNVSENNERQLEALNSTMREVQEAHNTLSRVQDNNERHIEANNNTIRELQEAYTASTKIHDDIDKQLETLNNTLRDVQEAQNQSAEQVAFFAHSPTGTLVGNSPTFSTIVLNIGGGYNETSGQFHPTVAGLYSFSVTLLASDSRTGGREVLCIINKNSANVAIVETSEGRRDSASMSVYMQLTVEDNVTLQCINWNLIHISLRTSFTGALVRVD